jgi:phytoene dehydrogenase-like protein
MVSLSDYNWRVNVHRLAAMAGKLMTERPDAVVVGSGPNGLAAAIRLAQSGKNVLVLEASAEPGGALQSDATSDPGFIHDRFAAVFPLTIASPFYSKLDLESYGLAWAQPQFPLAHPFDEGEAILFSQSIELTAAELASDQTAYLELMQPLVTSVHRLLPALLASPQKMRPSRDLLRFGLLALRSARGLASSYFHEDSSQALFAGHAAHSVLPLTAPMSAGFGLVLALLGHTTGWPIVRGGTSNLARALVALATSLGVRFEFNRLVRTMSDIPPTRAILFDTSPNQLAQIAAAQLPASFIRRLRRHRNGPGVFKIDYSLSAPVPWRDPRCLLAGTLHLGGTMLEIVRSESEATAGRIAERPFVIASQPSLFDPSRAPVGQHTFWAYCHVPFNSRVDMTDRIERQIERFGPGFRDVINSRHISSPQQLAAANPNLVGGTINGGVQDIFTYLQWFLARPGPYETPNPAIFQCSAATPPGGGVHGMAGVHAADRVLSQWFQETERTPSIRAV